MRKSSKTRTVILAAGILLMAPLLGISAFSNPAKAQAYRNMTCGELWYARNAIYARQGYCFKTVRARQVFGPRCYEPWGRLTPAQQRRVDQIIYWERYYGCRR